MLVNKYCLKQNGCFKGLQYNMCFEILRRQGREALNANVTES